MGNSEICLTIDDQKVTTNKGKTILESALDAGIYIPHICHHPDLPPHGACRLCVVEIEGENKIQTSCTTLAEDGMVVRTKTSKLDAIRCLSLELMFTTHPPDCASCPKYLKCELQSLALYFGIRDSRMRRVGKNISENAKNPLFLRDMQRCIQCGRCIRACQVLRGVGVMDYVRDQEGTSVGIPGDLPLAEAGCRFCGACVEVCPTGALRDKEGLIKQGIPLKGALVPCRNECPAGVDIPRYVRLIAHGRPGDAAAVIREKVPFPLTLGLICNHRCELLCRRNEINQGVSICRLKLFAARQDDKRWKQNQVLKPASGKNVAVIGSGPCGLTAAYFLTKAGHKVTIFEALPVIGGMMRVGIPRYRLPLDDLQAEIAEIISIGVNIQVNTKVTKPESLLTEGFEAVLIATGAHVGQKLPIPGMNLGNVYAGIDFLKDVALDRKVTVGDKVVILGGGNVAFDCARTAKRLGAAQIRVAFIESREMMLADQEEITQAEEEGICLHSSTTFVRLIGENEAVTGVECQKVASFEFDENKKLCLKVIEGSDHLLEANTVIFSTGQVPERFEESPGLAVTARNQLITKKNTCTTSVEGIFAAGDAVTGTNSVIMAIAGGREAAQAIDVYLGGSGNIDETLLVPEEPSGYLGRVAGFAELKRVSDLGEWSDHAAVMEAGRCLQCDLRLNITKVKFWSGNKDNERAK